MDANKRFPYSCLVFAFLINQKMPLRYFRKMPVGELISQ